MTEGASVVVEKLSFNFEEERRKLYESQQSILSQKIKDERANLEAELRAEADNLRKMISNDMLSMKLLDFLLLIENATNATTNKVKNNVRKAIAKLPTRPRRETNTNSDNNFDETDNEDVMVMIESIPITKIRRVTRSMSRPTPRLSLTQIENPLPAINRVRESLTNIPATPKLHPHLPETPADYRDRVRRISQKGFKPATNDESKVEAPRTSAIFDSRPSITRVTRATIRPSIISTNNTDKAVSSSTVKRGKRPRGSLSVGGTVSLETDDGKTVDLDISASPSAVINTMEPSMVRDLGRLFKAYAAKMTAFYKKCKTDEKR